MFQRLKSTTLYFLLMWQSLMQKLSSVVLVQSLTHWPRHVVPYHEIIWNTWYLRAWWKGESIACVIFKVRSGSSLQWTSSVYNWTEVSHICLYLQKGNAVLCHAQEEEKIGGIELSLWSINEIFLDNWIKKYYFWES